MGSKRNQVDRFVIEVQGENLRCLQKAIEVATFSRDFNNSICCLSSRLVFVAESAIGSVLTLLQDVGVSGGQQELLSQLQHAERTFRIKSRPRGTVSPQCQSLDSLCSPKHHALFPGCILQH